MAVDRLSLAEAFADAGIERAAATRLATEIYDAIHDNVATKADLAQLRTELTARIDLVEHRLLTRLGGMIVVATGILIAISSTLVDWAARREGWSNRFHIASGMAQAYQNNPPGRASGTVTLFI